MLDTLSRFPSACVWGPRGVGRVFRELSVSEQRYQAVLTVIEDGLSVTEAAAKAGVSRQALHGWLGRYAAGGLEGLADRSHRPVSCPIR
jgi:transposase